MCASASSARSTLELLVLTEKALTIWLQNSTDIPQLCKTQHMSFNCACQPNISENIQFLKHLINKENCVKNLQWLNVINVNNNK